MPPGRARLKATSPEHKGRNSVAPTERKGEGAENRLSTPRAKKAVLCWGFEWMQVTIREHTELKQEREPLSLRLPSPELEW